MIASKKVTRFTVVQFIKSKILSTIPWSKMMLLQLLQFLQQAQHNLFKEEQEALRGIILQP
jgi:hypothetical protein